MGARQVIVESAIDRSDIEKEIDDLNQALGGDGEAEAIAFNFFSENIEISKVQGSSDETFLGQAVLINYNYKNSSLPDFSSSYIYEAIFRSPRSPHRDSKGVFLNLLNNYIHSKNNYEVVVCGQKFIVNGVYFCQQNNVTSVCAHACLKMSINAVSSGEGLITTRWINQLLDIRPPFDGLSHEQIKYVLSSTNFNPGFYDCEQTDDPSQYLSTLHSIVDSGFPSLLVFSTGDDEIDHVVMVFGHTLNTDEWHPQALPGYSGPGSAPYYSCSSWVDHFLIHDDNFGPYYSFSSRSLSISSKIKAKFIIGLYPLSVKTDPLVAESVSASLLTRLPQLLQNASGKWCEYIKIANGPYILRTFLAEKNIYINHLKSAETHDSSKMNEDESNVLDSLPGNFWVTEFSLPDLYMGNKTKLGEVLFDSEKPVDLSNPFNSILGVRAPDTLLLVSKEGQTESFPTSIVSHSPVYRRFSQPNEW
ncbi:hypothetical protein UR09_05315 [Candidatus Nitromaritima sp. SCGC AAA799-A02]|nr:hypothetical protein UR09_05315 [Candidatus Nitromaritima sp. SCGC AAA799-A02]KMP11334.1 hypothetical protein UZ36_04885 [Candidatus Nitromaritima sp. SCGC AAA799-C22]